MNCADVQEQMAEYVAGSLQLDVRESIRTHLVTCIDCKLWHETVMEMAELWWQDDASFDGPDLVGGVLQRLAEREPVVKGRLVRLPDRSSRRRLTRRAALHYGVAACMTVALFQFGVFDHLATGMVHNSMLLSNQVQSLVKFLGSLHF